MASKERDKFAERSVGPALLSSKMKAAAMYSSEEDEREGAPSSENNEQGLQGGGCTQQGSASNRRLSAESQDFEFNKLGGLTSPHMIGQLHEAGVQIASADELFYKGQLLPLHYSTRPPYINSISNSPIISPCHDTIEIPSSKLSLRDQDVRFSSCRMDHVGLDSSLFDFTRSSSFRSHSTNYRSYYCNYYANYGPNCTGFWDSSTTTSCGGESSSSSRDSNGSSQDSCSSSDNNREQHVCCHGHAFAGVNGPFSTRPKRKPGFMQSWKILFNVFGKGSHSSAWGADHQSNFHGSLRRAAANPNPNSFAGNQESLAACGCKLSKEKSCLLWAHEKEKGRANSSQISSDKQTSPNCNKKEKDNRKGSSSRWQGYTRRIKPISIIKATLVGGHANHESQRDHYIAAGGKYNREEQWQSGEGWLNKGRVTRQVPSLERRFLQPSLVSVSGVKGPSKVAFRFHAVSSSCPASVRSSPNHSGLLASPSFNNMSTLQDLHSAVQGAIAHCKQSISTPPS